MTPLEVATYLRCFQKAAATRKVKSRMIRHASRFEDNLAELIRSVLPKMFFRLVRRRRGYELLWMGVAAQAGRLDPHLVGWPQFREVVGMGLAQYQPALWIGQPTEALLEAAVALQPVLGRFKRDEARRAAGETVDPTAPEPLAADLVPVEQAVEEDPVEEFEEEVTMAPIQATAMTRPANPHNLAAEIAAATRARTEALAPNDNPAAFQTEGARRFAEMLARANRGRQ